jgi:hypothetical protein
MTEAPSADARKAACSILRYLLEHPQAKDTREGIAAWWLRQREIERAVHETFAGLDILVADHLVVERRGLGLEPYYSVNTAQRDAIARFLREGTG